MIKLYSILLTVLLSLPSNILGINCQSDSTIQITPEGIGQHLASMLVIRGDIKQSATSINIDQLLPNDDLSDYKDSPAEFILNLLIGLQEELPRSWYKLLIQADNLGIDTKAKYIKTFFIQIRNDQYTATTILKQDSLFYALSFRILEWEEKKYLMSINENIGIYNNIKKLIEDCFSSQKLFSMPEDSNHINQDVINDINRYPYNQSKIDIPNSYIPSIDAITKDITSAITNNSNYDDLFLFTNTKELTNTIDSVSISLINKNEKEETKRLLLESGQDSINTTKATFDENLKRQWINLSESLQKLNLKYNNVNISLLNNVFFGGTDIYNTIIEYTFKSDQIDYTCSIVLCLIKGQWKIFSISPIELKEEIQFQF